jgi:hypothetical protein
MEGESQRLASVDLSTHVGRLANDVALATYQWEEDHETGHFNSSPFTDAADWLEGLAQALEDPLNLKESLPQLNKLNLLGQVRSLGTGLDSLLSPLGEPGSQSGTPIDYAPLRSLISRLREIAAGSGEVEDVLTMRNIFSQLSTYMLNATEIMLNTNSGIPWTQNSAF